MKLFSPEQLHFMKGRWAWHKERASIFYPQSHKEWKKHSHADFRIWIARYRLKKVACTGMYYFDKIGK